jgi:hypothetical protein
MVAYVCKERENERKVPGCTKQTACRYGEEFFVCEVIRFFVYPLPERQNHKGI